MQTMTASPWTGARKVIQYECAGGIDWNIIEGEWDLGLSGWQAPATFRAVKRSWDDIKK